MMHPLKTTALLVPLVALTGCGKKPEPETPSPPSAAGGDRDKFQGMWAIESLDDGEEMPEKRREDLKNDRLKFEGDKLTVVARGREVKFAVTLDETQSQKVLVLTEVLDGGPRLRRGGATRAAPKGTGRESARESEPAGEPETMRWIYKFDGDALIVAFIQDGKGEKPTEFKARPFKFERDKPHVPAVSVLTLKKTDVPAPPLQPTRPTTSRMNPSTTRK